MIEITKDIAIPDSEIEEHFIRATGPGGQKVNKSETAVQLRFDARHSSALSNAHFLRLKKMAGRRMTADGMLVITARQFRTQEQNRKDAMDRLVQLIRESAKPPRTRRPTKTPKAQKRKRLENKRHKSSIKKARGGTVSRDE
ncbi:MAG: aminoacyl-tRNA hydrolase [Rhodospirillales bacterium]|nr:aminoacyl-tRNA hydrolase [Rhodospirillales bacterium]